MCALDYKDFKAGLHKNYINAGGVFRITGHPFFYHSGRSPSGPQQEKGPPYFSINPNLLFDAINENCYNLKYQIPFF